MPPSSSTSLLSLFRFVRRYPEIFQYNKDTFVITCPQLLSRQETTAPKVEVICAPKLADDGATFCMAVSFGHWVLLLRHDLQKSHCVYNLATQTWQQLEATGAAPSPRLNMSVTAVPREHSSKSFGLYFVGGCSGTTCDSDVCVLELECGGPGCGVLTGHWTKVITSGEAPLPRQQHSTVLKDNVLYVVGGRCSDGLVGMTVYALDCQTHVWTAVGQHGPTPSPRCGHLALLQGDVMYLVGGAGVVLDHLHVFDFATKTWSQRHIASGGIEPLRQADPLRNHVVGAALQNSALFVCHATQQPEAGVRDCLYTLSLKAPILSWCCAEADTDVLLQHMVVEPDRIWGFHWDQA